MYEMIKGWKVLSGTLRYKSAIQDFDEGGIYYYDDIWVGPLPGCGPLTVFKDKLSANYFFRKLCRRNKHLAIKDCLYIPDHQAKTVKCLCHGLISPHTFTTETTIEDLYRNNVICILPGSIALAEYVKILPERR